MISLWSVPVRRHWFSLSWATWCPHPQKTLNLEKVLWRYSQVKVNQVKGDHLDFGWVLSPGTEVLIKRGEGSVEREAGTDIAAARRSKDCQEPPEPGGDSK